jgi:hypothetical protein
MLGLRYIYVLSLTIWVGGAIAIGGIAAPATFASLTTHDPASVPNASAASGDPAGGRVLAGIVFGEILRRFYLASYAAGAALLLSLIVMALLGPRPAAFFVRAGIAALMLGLTLYAGVILAAQITQVQREIGVSVASLPADDPRRIEFGQLHGLSTLLMALTGVGGLVLLYWEARE